MQNVSWPALKQHWRFWDAYLECPKYLMFLKKKVFLEKVAFRQIIREAYLNYFETRMLIYPGAWRTLFWSQDVTVYVFFKVFLVCLFELINSYLFIFKSNKVSWSFPWILHGGSLKIHKQFIYFEILLKNFMVFILLFFAQKS